LGAEFNELQNLKAAMFKKITTYLDYSMFAEIALVMFAAIFIAVVIRTLCTRSDITSQQAKIVLGDQPEEHA
jgi:hypothetical protein